MRKKVISVAFYLIPWICVAVGVIYVQTGHSPILVLSSDDGFHFNLITVTAVFEGFLYTNYTLLVGILNHKSIEELKNTEIVNKRNRHILIGIIYSTIVVIAGMLFIVLPTTMRHGMVVRCVLVNVETTFMAFVMIHFLLSLYEMNMLICAIHHPSNKRSNEEIKMLREQIKKE